MTPDRATPSYEALLQSLADGVAIDWAALDAAAASGVERRRYSNLRLVARVAELHRTLPPDDDITDVPGRADDDRTVTEAPAGWGHLVVLERIGGGMYGDVYRASDPQLRRDVALKLLRTDRASSPPDRLLAEARILAQVRHPNVVIVHGADVRDGRAGLWMELVQGQTLHGWLQSHGLMGAGETTAAGVDLCRALAAVHAAGLVHGDVKAHNVMREDKGRLVLMDFGAGRAQGAAAFTVAGTPLYLAPEVLAGEPATPRSDIHSLGVLLFHLLTGSYPRSAQDLDGLRAAHANGERAWLRDLRPDLPGALVRTIERALDPDPARRFAAAGEMERSFSLETDPPPSRPTWHWMIVAGILLAGVVALLLVVLSPRAASPPRLAKIAVLPFDSTIDDRDRQPLVEGLAGEVVREMQRFDLQVKYAGTGRRGATIVDSGARLDADGLVRGSLRKAQGRTAVHIAVVRAGGEPFWSREYDVYDTGLPSIARTIAKDVAAAVGAALRPEVAAAAAPPKYSAYAAYQHGRVLAEQRETTALLRSLDYFKQAAALDPGYAEPWAGLADSYIALGVSAFGPLPPLEARRLAKAAAESALDRNPNLAEAHTSLAFAAFFHDWDWAAADARFRKAIQLNPQYALAHHWYADYLNAMGRQREAMAEIERAQAIEPLSVLIHRDVGWHLFFQSRFDEAIAHLQETLQMDPDYAAARTLLARALAERGRYAEALEELRLAAPRMAGARGVNLSFIAYVQAKSGDTRAADLTMVDVRRLASTEYVPPYYAALVYTAEGNAAKALDELERAYREQDSTLVGVRVDPRFAPLRREPRFVALVDRMRFPPVQP
jgi:eukaryotic-like serine/threonine-protein kinase